MMICQSRNGDEEDSYLSVICSTMVIRKYASARRGPLASDRQERFAGQGNAVRGHEPVCFDVVTKSEQEGQVETKGFEEYALQSAMKGKK
jgi:hypothetical protein